MRQIINFSSSEAKFKMLYTSVSKPSAKQVLIKIIVFGFSPKDWKVPEFAATYSGPDNDMLMATSKADVNRGDDVAGIVKKAGEGVIEFKIRPHLQAGNFGEVQHGLDPSIGLPSQKVLTEVVGPDGAINLVLPSEFDVGSVTKTTTSVGIIHNQEVRAHSADGSDLGFVTCH
ncbi:hypothetical protein N0V90_001727 [Kalmusia sp. IMI 367209]|nr:hypothetical protein N0V90_001727 [Kalmusia sp. IMI 367209]